MLSYFYIGYFSLTITGSAELHEGDIVTFGHPNGVKFAAGTRVRQPDSPYQFIVSLRHLHGLSQQGGICQGLSQELSSWSLRHFPENLHFGETYFSDVFFSKLTILELF